MKLYFEEANMKTLPHISQVYVESMEDAINVGCELIALTDGAFFEMSGFGQNKWPVDVAIDLATVLEQLPDAINQLQLLQGEFNIDLYEQGVERYLNFKWTTDSDIVIASCNCLLDWHPIPSIEKIDRLKLINILTSLQNSFCLAIQAMPLYVKTKLETHLIC